MKNTKKIIDFKDEKLVAELEKEAKEKCLTFNAYIRLLVIERRK